MRLARAAVIAVLLLVTAVTPLSAFLSGGSFETWVGGAYERPLVRITLRDHTGLVRQFTRAGLDRAPDVSNPNGNQRVLLVSVWGGCADYWVHLDFRWTENGYVIRQHNHEFGCPFFALIGHGGVALTLWSPVDASDVRLDSRFN